MTYRSLFAALATLVVFSFAASSASADPAKFRTVERPVTGQYIVVLKPDAARLARETHSRAPRVPEIARDMTSAHRSPLVRSYTHALRGFVVKADDAALARLLADPRVDYVEEDAIGTLNPTQNNATWGIDRIDQRNRPLSTTYTYDLTASNVHAYIVDSGLRASHQEFTGRVGNGFTAINDGRGTGDCNGHGTHVAGTVGGTQWGVAKGVTIHPVRIGGCGSSLTSSETIAGIDWVTANHVKPAVANMSFGFSPNTAIDASVNALINAGVTVVVAAGNSNTNACNFSPARVANAITVGSTDSNDARSSFSNVGTCVDLFAPGGSIVSAGIASDTASATLSGTSMASPHVAGAAALHLAANTAASPAQTAAQIVGDATLNVVGNPGSGSPNRLLFVPTAPTPPVITQFSCSGTGGGYCSVTALSSSPMTYAWSGGFSSGCTGPTCSNVCGTLGSFTIKVTVTVTNSVGSTSADAWPFCQR